MLCENVAFLLLFTFIKLILFIILHLKSFLLLHFVFSMLPSVFHLISLKNNCQTSWQLSDSFKIFKRDQQLINHLTAVVLNYLSLVKLSNYSWQFDIINYWMNWQLSSSSIEFDSCKSFSNNLTAVKTFKQFDSYQKLWNYLTDVIYNQILNFFFLKCQ